MQPSDDKAAQSVSDQLDTRSWYSRPMTRQPNLYQISLIRDHDTAVWWQGSPICIFYAYLSVFHPPVLYHEFSAGSDNASYISIHYALKNKSRRSRRWWMKSVFVNRGSHGSSSLLRDLKFQSVSGQYKNSTRMSPTEFEYMLTLIWGHITKGREGWGGALRLRSTRGDDTEWWSGNAPVHTVRICITYLPFHVTAKDGLLVGTAPIRSLYHFWYTRFIQNSVFTGRSWYKCGPGFTVLRTRIECPFYDQEWHLSSAWHVARHSWGLSS
jgi:hypothetical protein